MPPPRRVLTGSPACASMPSVRTAPCQRQAIAEWYSDNTFDLTDPLGRASETPGVHGPGPVRCDCFCTVGTNPGSKKTRGHGTLRTGLQGAASFLRLNFQKVKPPSAWPEGRALSLHQDPERMPGPRRRGCVSDRTDGPAYQRYPGAPSSRLPPPGAATGSPHR